MAERSVGARKFAQMPGTPAEKAKRYGRSVATISKWSNGHHKPEDNATLTKIEEDGGPLPCEWDEQPPAVNVPPRAPAAGDATPATVQAEATRLLQFVRQAMTEAELEEDLTRRMAIAASGANIMRQLGRVVGAGHAVTERQILESPHWRLMCDRIVTALEPWPDALAAVGTSLEGTSAQPT